MEDTPATMRQYPLAPSALSREAIQDDLLTRAERAGATSPSEPPSDEAPIASSNDLWALYFSSGAAGRPAHGAILQVFNGRVRELDRARQILFKQREEFTELQQKVLRWLIESIEDRWIAKHFRDKAQSLARTPRERAIIHENDAFFALRRGEWESAKRICEQGIEICPTAHGLWINLLVAMDRLGEDAAIELVLSRLSRIIDVNRGLLGLYLVHDPAFRTAICDGG